MTNSLTMNANPLEKQQRSYFSAVIYTALKAKGESSGKDNLMFTVETSRAFYSGGTQWKSFCPPLPHL